MRTKILMLSKQLKQIIWWKSCKYFLVHLPFKNFLKLVFWINNFRLGTKYYNLCFNDPRTFNEKIIYLMLNDRNDLIPITTDKIRVRKFVKDRIGKKYLIPLVKIFNSIDEIEFSDLPKQFALKTTHGCGGWNLICENKDQISWKNEKGKLKGFLKMNPYFISREWQYNFRPKLICEELIGYNLIDYKFFCSKGIVKAIQVDLGRFTKHERIILNPKWEKLNIYLRYKDSLVDIKKPSKLKKMIEISEKLSSSFLICRVDLFFYKNQIYFGEITHSPGGGVEPFMDYQQDLDFGRLFSF